MRQPESGTRCFVFSSLNLDLFTNKRFFVANISTYKATVNLIINETLLFLQMISVLIV